MNVDAPQAERSKPRPTIRSLLILVAALTVDFALFRNAVTHVQLQSAAVWLYVILIVYIWRYVPAPWDRLAYLLIFLVPFVALLAAFAWLSAHGLLN